MAAVWALPNAPLRSAITNDQPFSTADQVCNLVSQMIPFGPQLKQGLSASLPVFLSTVIIMAPVPESIMRKINEVIVPSNERMQYTLDGRPCVRYPTMVHRIRLSLGSSPVASSPHSTQNHLAVLESPLSVPQSATTTPCNRVSKLKSLTIVPVVKNTPPAVETPQPLERFSTPKLITPIAVNHFLPPPPPFRRVPLNWNRLSKRRLVSRIYLHCQPH